MPSSLTFRTGPKRLGGEGGGGAGALDDGGVGGRVGAGQGVGVVAEDGGTEGQEAAGQVGHQGLAVEAGEGLETDRPG